VQQWEYLQVEAWEGHWADGRGRSGELEWIEPKVAHLGAYSFAQLADELGAEGWEMTGAVPGERRQQYRDFFKRP
jgi:hypothetical protein